jgi:hypothetical protein
MGADPRHPRRTTPSPWIRGSPEHGWAGGAAAQLFACPDKASMIEQAHSAPVTRTGRDQHLQGAAETLKLFDFPLDILELGDSRARAPPRSRSTDRHWSASSPSISRSEDPRPCASPSRTQLDLRTKVRSQYAQRELSRMPTGWSEGEWRRACDGRSARPAPSRWPSLAAFIAAHRRCAPVS